MKCQNCGKYEANFHYSSNVNGHITEQHLCQECAATMEGSVFAGAQREMEDGPNVQQSLFYPESMFDGNSLWDNMTNMSRSIFSDFWNSPKIVMISPATYKPGPSMVSSAPADTRVKSIPVDAGDKFKKRREINKLRSEMISAVKEENFERAAELRDQIYSLEKESAENN